MLRFVMISLHWRAARLGALPLLLFATILTGIRLVGAVNQPTDPGTSAQVSTFGGNAQHTSVFGPAAANLNAVRWSTTIDLNPTFSNTHYGAPVVTAANTVLVPVKNAFDGANGSQKYAPLTTDYVLPTRNWIPVYNPALATYVDAQTRQPVTRLYYAGAGGTIFFVENPDSSTHGAPVRQAFYGLNAYQQNPAGFNATVFINTPVTADTKGNVFFGFRVQGTAPAPVNSTRSGFARMEPDGTARFVFVNVAAGDAAITSDSHNSAPALSNDESTLYVVAKSAPSSTNGFLLGLDAGTLATKFKVALRDPRNNRVNGASISDDSTASPTVAPDGDVFFGVLGNPGNGSRGFLLHFSGDLSIEKPPGGFGWDSTAAIVPASMVPLYTGTSPYLIFGKYNNYAFSDGDGVNRIALLDPNATQIDPHTSANGLVEMREVLTVIGPTPDQDRLSATFPNAVREWCINTAAVNPATNSIFVPNEDGRVYRWDLVTNSLSQAITVTPGLGQPYVPTIIGPDGTVITLNGGSLFALGTAGNVGITLSSSVPDLRNGRVGDSVTFTADVTGAVPGDTVTFRDVYYPDQVLTPTSIVLAQRVLIVSGRAPFTTSVLGSGSHFITATHDGSATSITRLQEVHQSGTTTKMSGWGAPGFLTLTAGVTTDGRGSPTGMVTFLEANRVLAQVPLTRSGTASFTTSTLGGGTRTITAVYASDPLFAASAVSMTYSLPSRSLLPRPLGMEPYVFRR
jgi:hypothetical protein